MKTGSSWVIAALAQFFARFIWVIFAVLLLKIYNSNHGLFSNKVKPCAGARHISLSSCIIHPAYQGSSAKAIPQTGLLIHEGRATHAVFHSQFPTHAIGTLDSSAIDRGYVCTRHGRSADPLVLTRHVGSAKSASPCLYFSALIALSIVFKGPFSWSIFLEASA